MMSAVIPRNVVCGNKVPTIIFPNDSSGDLIYLWIGITNSFVFDWMIRRIISTTVNYFLLFSIPMPTLSLDSDIAQEIIKKTKQLAVMNGNYYTSDLMGDLRGDIDVLVARAYGLNFKDMSLILSDFPIMDRKQPRIGSEKKSTVTRDLVLSKCEQCEPFFDNVAGTYTYRYEQAKKKGAHAYIPTEMTELTSRGGV
jgi:type II site-specific deoxyribonuclease